MRRIHWDTCVKAFCPFGHLSVIGLASHTLAHTGPLQVQYKIMCGAAGLTPLPASSSISATSSGISVDFHLQLHLHIQLHLQQFQGVDNADDRNDAAADGDYDDDDDDDHEDEDEDDVERKPKPSSILTLINSSIREKNNTK